MLQRLKTHQRYYETLFLFLLSCYCFALSLFRLIYSDTLVFIFLNANLFLAFLPWFFSSLLIIYPKLQQSKIAVTVLLCTWLLFFPNAPYILTDLFHLRHQFSMPVWFDLALILSFAWTGLLFGLLSLWDIEKVLRNFLPPKVIPLVLVSLLFLGSFGIYLGRYLRWNSWDILREPFGILYDISDRLVNPLDHPRTWGMTIIMGLFLNMVYWSFHFIRDRTA